MALREVSTPLHGTRVTLTPLQEEDAAQMAVVLGEPSLYLFTGGGPPTRAALAERYRRQAAGGPPDGSEAWLNWIVRLDGDPVGYVQATVTDGDGGRAASLAWVIGAPWQGRGLGSEAATLTAEWLAAAGVTRLNASVHPRHAASQAVARRLGMSPTGEVTREGEEVWAVAGGRRPLP